MSPEFARLSKMTEIGLRNEERGLLTFECTAGDLHLYNAYGLNIHIEEWLINHVQKLTPKVAIALNARDFFTVKYAKNKRCWSVATHNSIKAVLLAKKIFAIQVDGRAKFSFVIYDYTDDQRAAQGEKHENGFLWCTGVPDTNCIPTIAYARYTLEEALKTHRIIMKPGTDGFNYKDKKYNINFTLTDDFLQGQEWPRLKALKNVAIPGQPDKSKVRMHFSKGFLKYYSLCKDCLGVPARQGENLPSSLACFCGEEKVGMKRKAPPANPVKVEDCDPDDV